MKVLVIYFFEIEYRSEKKMDYTDYLFRINQINTKYSQDRKNAKFILNIVYNNKRVYESERYKDLIKELIQVSYRKVDLRETFYQIMYREIRKKIELYTILIYLNINKDFNYDLYTMNIEKRIP